MNAMINFFSVNITGLCTEPSNTIKEIFLTLRYIQIVNNGVTLTWCVNHRRKFVALRDLLFLAFTYNRKNYTLKRKNGIL